MSDRPSALVFSPEAPYPVIGGGAMRTASLLEYLRERYTLEVITTSEPGAPDPRDQFPADMKVHVLRLPFHSKTTSARAVRNLARFVRGVPPLIDRFSPFAADLARIVAGRHFALGVLEHFWCAPYVDVLRPVCDRVVLNLHNVESVLLERCGRSEPGLSKLLFRRWAPHCRRMEAEYLPRFDTVLVTSEADGAHLPVPCTVYPNAIPFAPLPHTEQRHEIVFSGNMEYHPNLTAVRWFAAEVWPGVRSTDASVVWRLVGKNENAVRPYVGNDRRIVLTGSVREAIPEIAGAAASIVPLLSGSGTRIKIIEAWAAGVPVISTTIGAEGLPGRPGTDYLVADTPAAFLEKINAVLLSPSLREDLGRRGRELYERELTWDVAWLSLKHTGL